MAKTTAKGARGAASKKAKPVKKAGAKPEKKAAPKSAKAVAPKKAASAPKAPAKGSPAKGAKTPAAPAPSAKGSSSQGKGPVKAPAPPASAKVAANGSRSSTQAPPPAPSAKGVPAPKGSRKGEQIILAPRASSPGQAAPARKPGSAPPRGREGGVTLVRRQTERPGPNVTQAVSLPIPVRKLETQPSIEDRYAGIEKRLEAQPTEFQADYWARFDKSWIYHDSALEGSVYTLEELGAGLGDQPVVTDSTLQPAADEIRRHKEAIEFVRDAAKKKVPITIDVIKKIYLILHPAEGDIKTVKYRRDIPQHRLYFHEYAQPDKIGYKVRQVVDWLNDPETRKTRNAIRIAARAHYDLLRVFPFPSDSGKVARLFMNLLLMRSGHPPAIIHATERQRYYDALKGEPNITLKIVQESVDNSLASVEKILDERESRARAFVS
jgi:hypothetical protein